MNVEKDDGRILRLDNEKVRWLIFSNQRRMNSISGEMADELYRELRIAEEDKNIKIILLRGDGTNYSSGADLSKFEVGNVEMAKKFRNSMNKVVLKMNSIKKPVIAVLHGYAMGGGLEIAESADIRISGSGAKIGQPEIKIGINAGAGGNVVLPKLIGRGKALYMMLTGEIISADTALRWGLIDMIFNDDILFEKSLEIAEKISGMPEETVSICKKNVYSSENLGINDALQLESDGFVELFKSKETMERISRFLKRNENSKN
ncbi:MAG: enoyl-CoA hydratase/isomerase family protein [Thermoplasmataceae archaeon]